MINTVLYDFGNVLVGWDARRALVRGMGADEVERFLSEVDFAALNHAQDAGRTWAEARAEVVSTHPEHAVAVDAYVEHFAHSLTGPVPGSAELVEELHAAGFRLFGLTNWSAELYAAAEPAAPAIGRMRDVVVSGREGVAKPDPAIFAIAIERFGLVPEETVFVDDSPANVAAARGLGLVAVHFESTARLRDALRDLGLRVAPG